MNSQAIRSTLTSAIWFWERGRIFYNLALCAVVLGIYTFNLPHAKQVLSLDSLLTLFVLAVLANVAYCAAYIVDIVAQSSDYRAGWLKTRWVLLVVGILFAAAITQFCARAIFSIET
ncbi:MAG: hypothetical protein J0I77_17915 [Rudaea sp.]|uniref:hypothetical protein n=1 Tax=unclassified Rudaea TaxID=2627037 RepID=UPI0010F595C3|nr:MULTISPECIES: hypothetical protein [unclassified Rudaea]MBN8887606.1 hypothetical protein [Rudaea sp.]